MINNIVPGKVNTDFRITQRFDTPVNYTASGKHGGIDIAPKKPGTTGVVLYAPHEGYVGVTSSPMLGNHTIITSLPYNNEGNCRRSLLAHLEKWTVKDGQFVSQGEPIGIMGGAPGMPGAGHSTGIHCHWEYYVLKNGKWVLTNVEPFIRYWYL